MYRRGGKKVSLLAAWVQQARLEGEDERGGKEERDEGLELVYEHMREEHLERDGVVEEFLQRPTKVRARVRCVFETRRKT